jgi:hypothetical protein
MTNFQKNTLLSYPRQRKPLSERFQAIYADVYKTSRNGRSFLYGITQWLESWMHKKVAKSSVSDLSTLEIGAGTLNQLQYEMPSDHYDIVEPFHALFEDKTDILPRIRNIYDDISMIPENIKYDRITSIAALEHIEDLPLLMARIGLMLRWGGGVVCAGIPSEGGFLWGTAWRISVGLSFYLRTGMNYGELMRHEHVSNAKEIIAVVQYFFEDVTVSRFPLPFHNLSLYSFITARKPNIQKCKDFIIYNQK